MHVSMEMTRGMSTDCIHEVLVMICKSWGLSYNLYADKLLGTNVFPQSIYDLRKFWVSPSITD